MLAVVLLLEVAQLCCFPHVRLHEAVHVVVVLRCAHLLLQLRTLPTAVFALRASPPPSLPPTRFCNQRALLIPSSPFPPPLHASASLRSEHALSVLSLPGASVLFASMTRRV